MIDELPICVIAYLVHKSCIPYIFFLYCPTKLLVRRLSCFCAPCVDQDWENYEVTLHVPLWGVIKLQPKDIHFVHWQFKAIEEPSVVEHEGDGEDLDALVCVKDNFAIPTQEGNNKGVELYIL